MHDLIFVGGYEERRSLKKFILALCIFDLARQTSRKAEKVKLIPHDL